MNRYWLPIIFGLSFALIAVLKSQETHSLTRFFKGERIIKIHRFAEVKSRLNQQDQELFEIWESILTGRTGPLSRWIKERYKLLALNHLFSPSGFHLSAVLIPVSWIIKKKSYELSILLFIGAGIFMLPGLGALKRMVLIKTGQKLTGHIPGFIIALLLDILFGTFQTSTLSFTYSFLFLGIIYSGKRGLPLFILIFVAQMMIAFFQNQSVSPTLIFLSPILNLSFGIAMPFLFALALPMWDWQIQAGLSILKILQFIVDISAKIVAFFPSFEVTLITFLIFIFLVLHRRKEACILLLLMSGTLNIEHNDVPSWGTYEYKPQLEIVRIVSKEIEDVIYFKDGKCKRRLVNGYWWEKCSPLRKSTRKKSKKLSYPS